MDNLFPCVWYSMMTSINGSFLRIISSLRWIHRSSVDSHHKGQWRGALMVSLICAWTKGWANNRDARDLRVHRSLYDVRVMLSWERYNSAPTIASKQPNVPLTKVRVCCRYFLSSRNGLFSPHIFHAQDTDPPKKHFFPYWVHCHPIV